MLQSQTNQTLCNFMLVSMSGAVTGLCLRWPMSFSKLPPRLLRRLPDGRLVACSPRHVLLGRGVYGGAPPCGTVIEFDQLTSPMARESPQIDVGGHGLLLIARCRAVCANHEIAACRVSDIGRPAALVEVTRRPTGGAVRCFAARRRQGATDLYACTFHNKTGRYCIRNLDQPRATISWHLSPPAFGALGRALWIADDRNIVLVDEKTGGSVILATPRLGTRCKCSCKGRVGRVVLNGALFVSGRSIRTLWSTAYTVDQVPPPTSLRWLADGKSLRAVLFFSTLGWRSGLRGADQEQRLVRCVLLCGIRICQKREAAALPTWPTELQLHVLSFVRLTVDPAIID